MDGRVKLFGEDSPEVASWRLTRRELSAAAGAAVAFVPAFSAMSAIATPERVPKALERATRWVQLALVEKDPATFDPDWWLDFFKRVHAGGACISAGGMCAVLPDRHSVSPPQPVARRQGCVRLPRRGLPQARTWP